jgi:hypothetical protein
MALCTILGFALPETRKEVHLTNNISDRCEEDSGNSSGLLHYGAEQVRAGTKQFSGFFLRLAREERHVFLLLLSLLLTTFGKDAGLMLMQYITVKFHWEWSEVSCVVYSVLLLRYQSLEPV